MFSSLKSHRSPGLDAPHVLGVAVGQGAGLDLLRLPGAVAAVRDRLWVDPAVGVDAVTGDAAVLHALAARVGALRSMTKE